MTEIKKQKKKFAWKWLVGGIVVLGIILGVNAYKLSKAQELRRAAMAEQRQVLIDAWTAQGLTQEEIDEKLQADRDTRFQSEDRPPWQGVMRVITGGGGMRH